MSRAVVLGAGMAGVLSAAVLARHVDTVTVVDGDEFPVTPAPRKGLPQGRHSHMFMAGGAGALDELLPGTIDALVAAGANRRGMPWGTLTLSAGGWFTRHEGDAFIVICSRDLTDHVVRERGLADPTITLLERTRIRSLTGDADTVTGVVVEDDDGVRTLPADLVVDATGRRSRGPRWLAELGAGPVDEATVDAGLTYSTRLYAAPANAPDDLPAVLVQPRGGTGEPARGGTLFPIEGGRWIATMTGTRGGEPPATAEGFTAFARSLPHPLIADLLAQAEPISDVTPYAGTVNRRRYYERVSGASGYVAIGDAVAALNPVYAHGMSAAAREVVALRDELGRHGLGPGLTAAARTAIAAEVETPWSMASEQDLAFPDVRVTGLTPTPPDPQQVAFSTRMAATALGRPELANALFGVYTLSSAPQSLASPRVQELVAAGPVGEPLSAADAIAQFPELAPLL